MMSFLKTSVGACADASELEEIVPRHGHDVENSNDVPNLSQSSVSHASHCDDMTSPNNNRRTSPIITSATNSQEYSQGIEEPKIPITNLNENIVGWNSQDDPEMPLNFSAWKKWFMVSLLSLMTLVTPLASSILAPGIIHMDDEFGNDNLIVGSMTVSIYLLGYVVGPLFLAPLSEMYGRRPVLAAADVFFCIWLIGCALAPNIQALIVFRFLCGVGGAGCLLTAFFIIVPKTLGGAIIGDLFPVDQRGFAMGVWIFGVLFGPTLGPLIGGFVAETIGWRWDFWIVLAVAVVTTVLIEIFNTETNHHLLIERKTKRLRGQLGRDDLKNCYSSNDDGGNVLAKSLIRPLKMLGLFPLVTSLSLYIAFAYGVAYLLFTTIPSVFQEVYGFELGLTGLVYLSLGAGYFLGWAIFTFYSDKQVIEMTRANGGQFVPEMRLYVSIPFALAMPVTFFWYGWSAHYHVHWISSVLSLIPFGLGIVGIWLPITTYMVDCYPMYAASALAANTVLRSLGGALLPLAGQPMYDSLGLGWGNSLLGCICLAMIPLPILFYRFGERLRRVERFKL